MAPSASDSPLDIGLPAWPAPERNKGPLLDVLQNWFHSGLVVELASGTGQHAVHFARGLPGVTWQPSEVDRELVEVVAARVTQAELDNLKPPIWLDVGAPTWPLSRVEGLFCANLLHISAWQIAESLFRGASRSLVSGAYLLTYGPYRKGGVHTSVSNADFDASLKQRNPEWGVRDIHDLEACAAAHGLTLVETISMPANNLTLVWQRR